MWFAVFCIIYFFIFIFLSEAESLSFHPRHFWLSLDSHMMLALRGKWSHRSVSVPAATLTMLCVVMAYMAVIVFSFSQTTIRFSTKGFSSSPSQGEKKKTGQANKQFCVASMWRHVSIFVSFFSEAKTMVTYVRIVLRLVFITWGPINLTQKTPKESWMGVSRPLVFSWGRFFTTPARPLHLANFLPSAVPVSAFSPVHFASTPRHVACCLGLANRRMWRSRAGTMAWFERFTPAWGICYRCVIQGQ